MKTVKLILCSLFALALTTVRAQLSISTLTVQQPSCSGMCDGSATFSVTGAVGSYSIFISNTSFTTQITTSVVTGLCGMGSQYVVSITDQASNNSGTVFSLMNPAAVSAIVSKTNPSCFGACNGSVTITGIVAPAPYTYTLNGIPTGSIVTNLCAGVYTMQIANANGCTNTQVFSLTQPSVLSAITSQTDVACSGNCTGEIFAAASGGTPAYTYSWSTGVTTADVHNLCPGTYTLTVKDTKACQYTKTITITSPPSLSVTVQSTDPSCQICNGTASVQVSGGIGPYTYLWLTGATTPVQNSLCSGAYSVQVSDANA